MIIIIVIINHDHHNRHNYHDHCNGWGIIILIFDHIFILLAILTSLKGTLSRHDHHDRHDRHNYHGHLKPLGGERQMKPSSGLLSCKSPCTGSQRRCLDDDDRDIKER